MFIISRTVCFSATHTYRIQEWSEEKNRSVFGPCCNPNGHGHDYKLEVAVKGPLIAEKGIVVNTTEIKQLVTEFIEDELDGKFLDRENRYFQKHIPTTENLVNYLWTSLEGSFQGCSLHRIRLHENHYLCSEKEAHSLVRLTRKYHFCAAHRLHSDQLSHDENRKLFGKCNNPHGHGHNYFLDVTVSGNPDPVTGMIINLADLDNIVQKIVLEEFDHKHLNLDTEQFKELNPTSEVLAMVIFNMLSPHIPNLHKIGLWETEKNYFEYAG